METGGTQSDLYLKAKTELPQYFLHTKKKKKEGTIRVRKEKVH